MLSAMFCMFEHSPVLASEKTVGGGGRARTVKVPTVSDVQESLPDNAYRIASLKRVKKGPRIYELPTMHGNLG